MNLHRFLPFMAALVIAGCGEDALRVPDPAVVYVAFGDSSTRGPARADYVDFLRERLGQPAEAFSNEGNGGETTAEGLDRLRSYIDRGLFPNARFLLYWEGGVDLIQFMRERDPFLVLSPDDPNYPLAADLTTELDRIQGNIRQALRAGRNAGWEVIAATYFFLPNGSLDCDPLFLDILTSGQAVNANKYVVRLNDRIRQAAAQEGATVADVAALDAELRGNSANYYNCNHLSGSGNEIAARAFYDAIQSIAP